ncbi:uncharacterized protein LOC110817715 isoform X2 [Carica papaya]|uniref:uncharacterized protein LOC110817715 isoform X2 n=1 Tax=Carica papaya TaxID=3649 RepID=UPI000B8C7208|nr:uncharacterized protein LOC110817715 isoform X2 [Carica papaya]
MTVLRSRQVTSTIQQPKPKTPQTSIIIEPATPVQTREPATQQSTPIAGPNDESVGLGSNSVSLSASGPFRRRSIRLASKSVIGDCSNEPDVSEKNDSRVSDHESVKGNRVDGLIEEGFRVLSDKGTSRKREKKVDDNSSRFESETKQGNLILRSGKRIVKRRVENASDCKTVCEDEKETGHEGNGESLKGSLAVNGNLDFESEAKNSVSYVKEMREKKEGKRILREVNREGSVNGKLEKRKTVNEQNGDNGRRYSREEKKKGKMVEHSSPSNCDEQIQEDYLFSVAEELEHKSRMEQFRDIARENASRFAHYNPQDDETEAPGLEVVAEIEDWPGPFSTAMKIIRDRSDKSKIQQGSSSSVETKSAPVIWVPKRSKAGDRSKLLVPSLKELCMKILIKNADAITSLEYIPDAMRHKLSQLLCDSRRMNAHFLDLLVRGSPSEIRLRDCSWLTEEQFTKCFEGCDTSSLTVLQLDQCGRCLPDYVLRSTLGRSSNYLPALTTLSLSAACRLSDVGLRILVSSTPALRSINLSQCSLLTPAGFDILAGSLGSVLRELYINDCQSIDAMLILPALKRLEHLEVLSLVGMLSVNDIFLRQLIIARGRNMKELILGDCVKLTDLSVKIIAESCPRLCALDLVNLCKLTDCALGYLANSCQALQTLKLSRNSFSDDAVAAYLETSGQFLKELSLNNVKKVLSLINLPHKFLMPI